MFCVKGYINRGQSGCKPIEAIVDKIEAIVDKIETVENKNGRQRHNFKFYEFLRNII